MIKSKILVVLVALFIPVGLVVAQVPALSASGTTTPPTVTLSVTNAAANAHVILAASFHQGPGTMGGVTLGIAPPWFLMEMGVTNASGALTLTANVGMGSVPGPLSGLTAYVQAGVVTMGGTMGGGMGGGMNGGMGGGMNGGGMNGGGMGSGSMNGGGTINCGGGMTITLSNVASFVFP